jgi:hypothetical protein
LGLYKDIETQSGIKITDAYFRLDTISGSKNEITFVLNCYLSKEHFSRNFSLIDKRSYTFIPNLELGAPNIFDQCYNHAKTIDIYKDEESNV